jgi:hypothetical protein
MSGDACTNLFLDPYGNLQNFYNCAKAVQVLKTTKHAEWWQAKTSNPVQNLVIKLFLNPQYVLQQSLQHAVSSFIPDVVQASNLTYNLPTSISAKFYKYVNEQSVYANVLQPLVLYKASPYFYMSRGEQNLSASTVIKLYGGQENADTLGRLAHVISQMLNPATERPRNNSVIPSPTDVISNVHEHVPDASRYFFNMLVLQVPSGAQTFKPSTAVVEWDVLFQVAVACYAMQLSCLTHHRLTPSHVDVVTGAQVQYVMVKSVCYALHTTKHMYLKQFQHATLGVDNFQPLKDFITFCYHYANRRESVIDELLPLLVNASTTPPLNTSTLFSALEQPRPAVIKPSMASTATMRSSSLPLPRSDTTTLSAGGLGQMNKLQEMKQQFMQGLSIEDGAWKLLQQYLVLNTLEDIIYLLSQKCDCKLVTYLPEDTNKVYTLHPDMFDVNGKINPVLNHGYALHKFQYHISTASELDQEIEITNNLISELEGKVAENAR